MKFILDLCFEILDVEIWENSLCIFVYVKLRVFLMYVCWAAGLVYEVGRIPSGFQPSALVACGLCCTCPPSGRARTWWCLETFWNDAFGTVKMQQNLGKWGFLMSMNHDRYDITSCDWLKLFSTLSQLMTHQSLPPAPKKKKTVASAFGTLPVPTCRFTCNCKGIKYRSLRAIQIVS